MRTNFILAGLTFILATAVSAQVNSPRYDLNFRANVFAGWMPIMPGQLSSGMTGFNLGFKEMPPVNIGLFYQKGSGSHSMVKYVQNGFVMNRAEVRDELESRSYGFIYKIAGGKKETFLLIGEIKTVYENYIDQGGKMVRNRSADKTEKKFMFSFLHGMGRIFFQVGSTFNQDAIAGVGFKI